MHITCGVVKTFRAVETTRWLHVGRDVVQKCCDQSLSAWHHSCTIPPCPIKHPSQSHLETAIDRLVLVGNVDAGNIVLELYSTFQRKVNEYQDTLESLNVGVSVCACVCVCVNKTWIERTIYITCVYD